MLPAIVFIAPKSNPQEWRPKRHSSVDTVQNYNLEKARAARMKGSYFGWALPVTGYKY